MVVVLVDPGSAVRFLHVDVHVSEVLQSSILCKHAYDLSHGDSDVGAMTLDCASELAAEHFSVHCGYYVAKFFGSLQNGLFCA